MDGITAECGIGNELIREPFGCYDAEVVLPAPSQLAFQLLILNVMLQIFDGLATYNGLRLGVKECNPLLCNAFECWGVGPTLLLFKSFACATLFLIYRAGAPHFVARAFWLIAAFYGVCSLMPWLAMLLTRI